MPVNNIVDSKDTRHNWQFCFLFAKQINPNQSNRRSTVQWYFPPFSIPCFTHLFSQMFEVFDALDPAVDSVRPPVGVEQLDDDLRRVLQEPVADFLDDLGARVGCGCRRSETRTTILKKRLEWLPNDSPMSDTFPGDNIPHRCQATQHNDTQHKTTNET